VTLSIRTKAFFKKLEENQIEFDASRQANTERSKATFQVNGKVFGLIKPSGKDQIVTILNIANEFKIPLYPISQGKNWGYGSTVPPREGAVVLSIQRLNKISDFDHEHGIITVESGVTFQQVQNFLKEQKSRWQLNSPGSTTSASVAANMLSRGLIQGPKLEKWKDVIAIEATLPNGEIIQTDDQSTTSAFRSTGTGPDLMPLFFQSNIGVVTEMKLKLDLRPNYWQHLHITWKEECQSFSAVITIFKELLKESMLAGSLSIHSAEKVLTFISQYPFEATQGKTPLPPHLRDSMLNEIAGGEWFAETAIAGQSEAILNAYKTIVEQAFETLTIDLHWSEINAPGPVFHFQTETAPEQMYWRKTVKAPDEIKPELDGCGILWISPVLPWDNTVLCQVTENVNSIVKAKGFEFLMTFQFPDFKYGYAIISLLYDRDIKGADEKALEAFNALKTFFNEKKYFSYRHSLLEQPMKMREQDLRIQLKKITDPNNIIAPDFYIPHQV